MDARAYDIRNAINAMPLHELLVVLDDYAKANGVDFTEKKAALISEDMQSRLKLAGINSHCPHCGSVDVSGYGKSGNVQRYRCKACEKTFTLFSGTILEKTRYSWETWVRVVAMSLNNMPVEHIQKTLCTDLGLDGLDFKTVFLWKHKVLHALAEMPTPKLNGMIQIDETFFRESQKGSRKLQSTIREVRHPRYGRQPSEYGTMGNEFANVVCMVDSNGYAVAEVIGLGKLSSAAFAKLFEKHVKKPSYICTEGNNIYKKYCSARHIPLYVKPSDYLQTIKNAGYIFSPHGTAEEQKKQHEKNRVLLTELYKKRQIDYICNAGRLTYTAFSRIKENYGLSLARVNQLHGELKRHLEDNTKGVSTKFLQDYIGAYVFARNWRIAHDMKSGFFGTDDAEEILIALLKNKTEYTRKDMESAQMPQKVSSRYMSALKKKTSEIRSLTGNPYFKFNAEDNVAAFDKRRFLEDLPKYKLDKLRRKYKISPHFVKFSVINELLKQPSIQDDILELIGEDKHRMDKEDADALADRKYAVGKGEISKK